jgi:hypothetical protein
MLSADLPIQSRRAFCSQSYDDMNSVYYNVSSAVMSSVSTQERILPRKVAPFLSSRSCRLSSVGAKAEDGKGSLSERETLIAFASGITALLRRESLALAGLHKPEPFFSIISEHLSSVKQYLDTATSLPERRILSLLCVLERLASVCFFRH